MRSKKLAVVLMLTVLALAVGPAPEPARSQDEGSAVSLLDRGDAAAPKGATRTHTLPTATLANLAGTPGVTLGAIGTVVPVSTPGLFKGYFFMPGVDFPTSYYPFFVTGAYAFLAPPLGPGPSPIIGAGVAAGPFTGATGTWAAFAAAIKTPVFTPGVVGMKGDFPHSPPTLGVPTGFGVACGADWPAPLAGLGGLTPGTGGGKPLVAFAPPGPGSGLGPIAAPPATYVAGCYITGATVPVELQAFSVE